MVWGMNTGRELARNQEEMIWVPVSSILWGQSEVPNRQLREMLLDSQALPPLGT